ncbi:hypothetical protein BLOT_005878 [Blomia tropicalis]|nr:hypothetical protein BLOT_005878 [Blomia tropicalis]
MGHFLTIVALMCNVSHFFYTLHNGGIRSIIYDPFEYICLLNPGLLSRTPLYLCFPLKVVYSFH